MIQQSNSWAYVQRKGTCTPMFTAALFTIAKTWQQPQRSTARGMDDDNAVHIHEGTLPSQKKNKRMAFTATWMDPEIIILSHTKSEQTNTIYDLHVESEI